MPLASLNSWQRFCEGRSRLSLEKDQFEALNLAHYASPGLIILEQSGKPHNKRTGVGVDYPCGRFT